MYTLFVLGHSGVAVTPKVLVAIIVTVVLVIVVIAICIFFGCKYFFSGYFRVLINCFMVCICKFNPFLFSNRWNNFIFHFLKFSVQIIQRIFKKMLYVPKYQFKKGFYLLTQDSHRQLFFTISKHRGRRKIEKKRAALA